MFICGETFRGTTGEVIVDLGYLDRVVRPAEILEHSVTSLVVEAHTALERAASFLAGHAEIFEIDGMNLVRWNLFIDRPNKAIETCAISCAVIGLLSAGTPKDSPLIEGSFRTLGRLQLDSGGWTSWVTDLAEMNEAHCGEEGAGVRCHVGVISLGAVDVSLGWSGDEGLCC